MTTPSGLCSRPMLLTWAIGIPLVLLLLLFVHRTTGQRPAMSPTGAGRRQRKRCRSQGRAVSQDHYEATTTAPQALNLSQPVEVKENKPKFPGPEKILKVV